MGIFGRASRDLNQLVIPHPFAMLMASGKMRWVQAEKGGKGRLGVGDYFYEA